MAYDWSQPLPVCDWCGEEIPQTLGRPWVDREDFWGHAECYPIAASDPDTIRARRAREAWSI